MSPPRQLIAWLENKLVPFVSSRDAVLYTPILPTCMVAITGWALDYPIIYTTHLDTDTWDDAFDEWEVRTNCLSNQPLYLVELYLSDHMLLSYSCPVSMTTNMETIATQSKQIVNDRLDSLHAKPDWLKGISCELRREQIKLDRFALYFILVLKIGHVFCVCI